MLRKSGVSTAIGHMEGYSGGCVEVQGDHG